MAALFWIPAGFLGVAIGLNNSEHKILDFASGAIFVLSIVMGLFLAARWCNKGNTFDLKKDSLYVLKNMGIAGLIYLSAGLIARFLDAGSKFFSF